ncbi:ubiquitin, putative [Schistosoma mansoni]|uniref:ubiquitin, putative n=1 Tax=Schistosoma mansoni TaxID=6183 RepID=UPI00019B34E6|nr:ubiquitin, putative [Schistosoma mansoni]|eukprot:XP_018645468.1 ubiquitin, putative [Schistosoma mansoni]
MQLTVKPLTRAEKVVQVNDDAYVSDLLAAVKCAFDINPEYQRLVFKGCPLLDKDKPLLNYGIKDGDRLTLLTKIAPQGSDFESLLRKYLAEKLPEVNPDFVVSKFLQALSARLNSMSFSDIENLASVWSLSG